MSYHGLSSGPGGVSNSSDRTWVTTAERWLSRTSRTIMTVMAAAACQRDGRPDDRRGGDDVTATDQCHRAVAALSEEGMEPPSPRDLDFVERVVPMPEDSRFTSIVGAAVDSRTGTVYILDGQAAALTAIDSMGRPVWTGGRLGEGPGEFMELPRQWSTNVLALADSILFVSDVFFLSAFSMTGEFMARTQMPNMLSRYLVTSPGDSPLLALNNVANPSPDDSRKRLRISFRRVRIGSDEIGFDDLPGVALLNRLSMMSQDVLTRRLVPFPYARFLQRQISGSADLGGAYAVGLLDVPGICMLDRDFRITHAFALGVPSLPVDALEREAITASSSVPGRISLRGVVIDRDEFYQGTWPDKIPVYVDVMISRDEWVAAVRLGARGSRMLDIFEVGNGYRGTIPLPDVVTPLVTTGNCLLVAIDQIDGQQLSRWCWAPLEASSG